MEFKDVLAMYFERGVALQTFWNFYITIALGYLAFLGVLTPLPVNKRAAVLLTCGFVVFAAANLGGLIGVTKQRLELQSLLTAEPKNLSQYPSDLANIRQTLDAPTVDGVIGVHVAGDALLLVCIWFIPAMRRSEKTRHTE
ncbi:MAG: hypothetical protein WBF89_07985 [Steroidobacteraceae bacterium]|jgi:hypothetical protein